MAQAVRVEAAAARDTTGTEATVPHQVQGQAVDQTVQAPLTNTKAPTLVPVAPAVQLVAPITPTHHHHLPILGQQTTLDQQHMVLLIPTLVLPPTVPLIPTPAHQHTVVLPTQSQPPNTRDHQRSKITSQESNCTPTLYL